MLYAKKIAQNWISHLPGMHNPKLAPRAGTSASTSCSRCRTIEQCNPMMRPAGIDWSLVRICTMKSHRRERYSTVSHSFYPFSLRISLATITNFVHKMRKQWKICAATKRVDLFELFCLVKGISVDFIWDLTDRCAVVSFGTNASKNLSISRSNAEHLRFDFRLNEFYIFLMQKYIFFCSKKEYSWNFDAQ